MRGRSGENKLAVPQLHDDVGQSNMQILGHKFVGKYLSYMP